ncbi:MAG: hypothetical protein Q8P41_16955 [Pseudomonadota bacterium]|nr:hypothetical protein [Pseudomonadota bacterium]
MRPSPSILAALLLVGCIGGGHGDGDSTDDTGGSIDSGDTDPVDRASGLVNGTVTVQLYEAGTDEDINEITWDEYGGNFPFGAIFVAAYTVDETTNATTYYDEFVISAPSTAGDGYSLEIDPDDTETVYVYAALDWWPDGVIGTTEPIGLHGDLVAVVEGGETNDVDIVINSPLLPTGGGGGGTYVALTGDVAIDAAYGGGDAKVMLYDSFGQGPSYVTSLTPTATADGAEGTFSLSVGANYGEGRLLGAWDDDMNGLIEPTDTWGAYVVAGENANPITVLDADISGYTVLLPYGLPPALTPFVRIEGAITYDSDFSSFAAGTTIYVAALRTRPTADFGVADLGRAYDWQSFTGAELAGTSLDYLLVSPSNAVAYVWAYADTDGDGLLNEPGEPVGSAGRSGRIATGSTNTTGLDLPLVVPF